MYVPDYHLSSRYAPQFTDSRIPLVLYTLGYWPIGRLWHLHGQSIVVVHAGDDRTGTAGPHRKPLDRSPK